MPLWVSYSMDCWVYICKIHFGQFLLLICLIWIWWLAQQEGYGVGGKNFFFTLHNSKLSSALVSVIKIDSNINPNCSESLSLPHLLYKKGQIVLSVITELRVFSCIHTLGHWFPLTDKYQWHQCGWDKCHFPYVGKEMGVSWWLSSLHRHRERPKFTWKQYFNQYHCTHYLCIF